MSVFIQLLPLLLQNLLSLFTNGLFWVILLVVGVQYRRMYRVSQNMFHMADEPIWPVVLTVSLYGILGGIMGSVLLLLVGVSVLEVGLNYLWIVALILMFVQQRFLCFAYAGGVVAISNLLVGFPVVSIPHVMGLVAILHLVEALLIYLTGPLYPIPMYVKTKRGQVVGGYNLQKFWPLPLVALVAWYLPNQEVIQEAVKMPEWWPLLKTQLATGQGELMYMMMPVVAALGYGDIALSELPREKTSRSALELAGYSGVLLTLAILASHYPVLVVLPALFGPLGHELLILLGQQREMKKEPIFVPPLHGIMVLHVLRKSPLRKLGLKDGDIILKINGQELNEEYELHSLLLEAGEILEIEYLSGKGQKWHQGVVKREFGQPLGFIPVPRWHEGTYVEVTGSLSLVARWFKKMFKRK